MIHCSATSGGNPSTVFSIPTTREKKTGLFKMYIPITFIIKGASFCFGLRSINTLIWEMWQQRRCRNKVTGPSKPQKAFQLIPLIESGGKKAINLAHCSVDLGRVREKGEGRSSMSKYLLSQLCKTKNTAELTSLLLCPICYFGSKNYNRWQDF